IPCFDPKVPGETEYRKLEVDMRALANAVKARAPQARLGFVQYFPMVPQTLCDAIPLSPAAADTGRKIGQTLARVTAKVAVETGAIVLPVDTIDAAHMPCGADPWVTGYPAGYKPGDTAPWHPTRAGHAAIANALADRLNGK